MSFVAHPGDRLVISLADLLDVDPLVELELALQAAHREAAVLAHLALRLGHGVEEAHPTAP